MMGTTMSSPGASQIESITKGLPMSVAPGTPVGNAILQLTVFNMPAIIGALKELDTTNALTGVPYEVFGFP